LIRRRRKAPHSINNTSDEKTNYKKGKSKNFRDWIRKTLSPGEKLTPVNEEREDEKSC